MFYEIASAFSEQEPETLIFVQFVGLEITVRMFLFKIFLHILRCLQTENLQWEREKLVSATRM